MKKYMNCNDRFGDPVEMTMDEFKDLAKNYPDWNIDPDLFTEGLDGNLYYEFGEFKGGKQMVGKKTGS